MQKQEKHKGKSSLVTKLTTFESNKKEHPLYKCAAFANEKRKGLMMFQHLVNFFGLNKKDVELYFEKEIKEQGKVVGKIKLSRSPIKWTRDEKGNIISPFSKKKKLIPK